jgi:hypothetical protein
MSIDPTRYVVGPDAVGFEDDLDEPITLPSGRVLRDEDLDEYAAEAVEDARRSNLIPGRKSLSGDGSHSPRVQYRVPQDEYDEAKELAAREGLPSVHALARKALEAYLREHRGAA